MNHISTSLDCGFLFLEIIQSFYFCLFKIVSLLKQSPTSLLLSLMLMMAFLVYFLNV